MSSLPNYNSREHCVFSHSGQMSVYTEQGLFPGLCTHPVPIYLDLSEGYHYFSSFQGTISGKESIQLSYSLKERVCFKTVKTGIFFSYDVCSC